jgi:hypothetical protein
MIAIARQSVTLRLRGLPDLGSRRFAGYDQATAERS